MLNATLPNIKQDLLDRVDQLRALSQEFDPELCARLAFYDNTEIMRTQPRLARAKLNQFVEMMRYYFESGESSPEATTLSGQLAFMYKVYSGAKLTSADCYEGSGFHRRSVISTKSLTRYLNKQFSGWGALLNDMIDELSDIDPQVIENIMIDESFELLGRDMPQSKY